MTLGLMMATSIVVGRMIGPSGRGDYQVLIALATLLAVLGSLSTDLGASSVFARTNAPVTTFLASITVFGLGLAIVSGALVFFGYGMYSLVQSGSGWDWISSGLAGGIAAGLLANLILQRCLLLTRRPLAAALTAAAASVVSLAIMGGIWVSDVAATTTTCIAAFLAGVLVEAIVSLMLLRVRPIEASRSVFASAVRSGLTMHPSQLALQLLAKADLLILSALSPSAVTGHYAVATSVSTPLGIAATTVSQVTLGRQFSKDEAESERAITQAIRVCTATAALGGIVIAIAAPVIVPWLWGDAFRPAVEPLWILLPGAIMTAAQRPIGNYLVRSGKAALLLWRTLAGLTTVVLCSLILVPKLGANGAAIASTLGFAVYFLISTLAFRSATGIGLIQIFLPKKVDA